MIASSQFSTPPTMTPEEYLAWEAKQELRYEYDGGKVTAMIGGTLPHNDLVLNLLTALRSHVKAHGCRIHALAVKVQIQEQGPYFYPDLVVSCDSRDRSATKLIRYPALIVEVLSPGTASKDRGKKFRELQRSESLQEYVLVDYESMRVECFRRGEGRFWIYEAFEAGEVVRLESVDFGVAIATIYEDVVLDAGEETD